MKSPRRPQAARPSVVHLSVYDGRTFIGRIVDRGGACKAYTVTDRPLGTFPTFKAAAQAIAERYVERGAGNG